MSNPKMSPKFIAVTGPTGVGKSTFINSVCGSKLRVGTSLQSCTDQVQVAHCRMDGQHVILIDTPGFDDTFRSQADILRDIANFLERTYEKGTKLAGLVYMHRISDYRVGGIARENYRLFSKICGDNAMKNVVIATTMWDEVTQEVGEKREQELKTKAIFFKDALDCGAQMTRCRKTEDSAKDVIRLFLDHIPEVLQMQHEIVDELKKLPETAAGTELQRELNEKAKKHQEELQELQEEMSAALVLRNTTYSEELQEAKNSFAQLQEKMKRIENEMRKLSQENKESREKLREGASKPGKLLKRARLHLQESFATENKGWSCFRILNVD